MPSLAVAGTLARGWLHRPRVAPGLARHGELARRLLLVVSMLPAAWHASLLVRLFWAQVPSPMDLEWMEGGEMYHGWRFAHGQPIYGSPAQGFVPYPYPPLHFVVLGAVGRLVGFGYGPARLVSVAFFLLGAVVLAREVGRRAAGGLDGLAFGTLAFGAIGATVPVVAGWYALVRNDSMAIGLPIAAAALAIEKEETTRLRVVALALTLVAVVYTKQTGVFFCVWILLFSIARNRRAGLAAAAVFVVVAAAALVALQLGTHGWFATYMLLQRHHAFVSDRVPLGAWELVKNAPYLLAVPFAAAFLAGRRALSARSALWVGMFVAAFPAALLPYAKAGGCSNNLMPIAVLGGPTAMMVALDLAGLAARARWRGAVARVAVAVFVALFLVAGRYDPERFAPKAPAIADARRLNAWVAALPGEVLALSHPMMALLEGKRGEQLHSMPIRDAYDGKVAGFRMAAWLRRNRPDWVIAERDTMAIGLFPAIIEYYEPAGLVPFDVPTTIATPIHSTTLYRRRPDRERARILFDFESTYFGWELSGDAFAEGPTVEQRACQQTVVGLEGLRLANSFTCGRFDAATGRALSPPLSIDRRRMGLLVGGGSSPDTRVELLVDGAPVLRASGNRSEELSRVVWDVTPWSGRQARLLVVDEDASGWGHVLLDDVELFD